MNMVRGRLGRESRWDGPTSLTGATHPACPKPRRLAGVGAILSTDRADGAALLHSEIYLRLLIPASQVQLEADSPPHFR